MWYTPGWGLLTAILFDSIEILNEKTRGGPEKYYKEEVAQKNANLNGSIKIIKRKYGTELAEEALKQIQWHINYFNDDFSVQQVNGKIILDQESFDYIISLLESCKEKYFEYEIKYSQNHPKEAEEYHKKAVAYEKLVYDVKAKKEEKMNQNFKIENNVKGSKNSDESGCLNFFIGLIVVIVAVLIFVK